MTTNQLPANLAEAWEQYEQNVIGMFAVSDLQRAFIKRTFYAGAQNMWLLIIGSMDLGVGVKATDGDLHRFDALELELGEFAKADGYDVGSDPI
jgi:hypothetical protein